jgi:hypothetical protein
LGSGLFRVLDVLHANLHANQAADIKPFEPVTTDGVDLNDPDGDGSTCSAGRLGAIVPLPNTGGEGCVRIGSVSCNR